MKKRILIFLCLALTLALCLLAGCKGGAEETTPATDPATDPATVTDPATTPATDPATDAQTEPATDAETSTDTDSETESATQDYFESTRIDLVEPDTSLVPDMAIAEDGYDIYLLTKDKEWGYRYGCTYLYNPDGSIDAYFACVGTISGEWDWISYRHSPDGGVTWEKEKIVLTPTQNSMDHFSNCDPGVVYFNGYYYLGYTSTLNSTGFCNNLFVARSKTPDGPFEKWNGNGWGGPECQPIVYFDESWSSWGIGEPSFVELNGTLYMYYTSTSPSGGYMMVATADATNENWPATLQFHGKACVKGNNDSLDVKYVEEWGKFVGVCTADRMGPNSWLAVYESNDGLNFELVDAVKEGTYQYLHNAGISSRPNGHIRITEDQAKLRVIYAYGDGWGVWNTRVQPISLTLSTGNDITAERNKKNIPDPVTRAEELPKEDRHIAMIRTEKDIYQFDKSVTDFRLTVYSYDTYFTRERYRKTDIEYSGYDPNIISIENNRAYIKGVGETMVTVTAGGLTNVFWVRITEEPKGDGTVATAFVPVHETITIYYGERSIFRPQIRGQIKWDNDTFTELFVDKQEYTLSFTYDSDIISVDSQGIVTARKVGETDVIVTWEGMSFVTRVIVTDDPAAGHFSREEIKSLDYTELDFTKKATQEAIKAANSADVAFTEEGAQLTVTGGDAFLWIAYSKSATDLNTADFTAIEITCKVPTNVSDKATQHQIFIICKDESTLAEPNSVRVATNADGEFHTIRLELKGKTYWHDNLVGIRFDFYDQSSVGDVLYLQSIKLIK